MSTLHSATTTTTAAPTAVLPDNLIYLSTIAAQLSALAYEDAIDYAVVTDIDGSIPTESPYYYHPDFEALVFFTQEPDQAIFARTKDQRCFLAFRGSTVTLGDWQQNLNLATRTVYRSNDPNAESCRAREGFADFQFLDESALATRALFDCIEECPHAEGCLIVTGHSQGGATATVLSLWLVAYKPMVITFGAPMALVAGCDSLPRNDTYRFVNSYDDGDGDELRFDAVPFLPTPFLSSLTHYGHFLVLGPRSETVSYMGNSNNDDDTDDDDAAADFSTWNRHLDVTSAHTMRMRNGTIPHSYEGRFRMSSSELQLVDGFPDGVPCAPIEGICNGFCDGSDHVCVGGVEFDDDTTMVPTQSPVAAIVEVTADTTGGDRDSSTAASTSGAGRRDRRSSTWLLATTTVAFSWALANTYLL